MALASLPNFQIPQLPIADPPTRQALISLSGQGQTCPTFLKTEDGQPLTFSTNIKLLKGTAYLFVAGNNSIVKPDEYREVFLVAGESLISIGRFRGRDISELQGYLGSRAVYNLYSPDGPYATNFLNGAGGLHNEILKNAAAADFAMVQAYQRTLPQIKISIGANSLVPGETQAVLNAARTLGLEPLSDGRSFYVPNTEFGGRAALAMNEALMDNARKQGLTPSYIPVSESVKGASPAFYKGVENGINDIRVGGLVQLLDATLGLLALGKAAGFKYRANWRAVRGLPKVAPVQIVPGGGVLGMVSKQVTRVRVQKEQSQSRVNSRKPIVPSAPESTNRNPNPSSGRNPSGSNRAGNNSRAGSKTGVDPSQVGNGNTNPGTSSRNQGPLNIGQGTNLSPSATGAVTVPPPVLTPTQRLAQERLSMIEGINQRPLGTILGDDTLRLLGAANVAFGENRTITVGSQSIGLRDYIKNGGWFNVSDKLAIVGIGDRVYVVTPQNNVAKRWTGSAVTLLPNGRLDLEPDLVPRKATGGNANANLPSGVVETDQPTLRTYMSPGQLQALVDINESFKSGGVNAKNWKALQKDGASLTLSDDMTLRNVGGKIYLIVGNGGSPVGSSVSRNANGVGLNLPPLVPDKAAVQLGFYEANQPELKTYMSPKQLRALVDINESFKSGGVNAKNWKALQKDGASLTLSDDMTLRNVGGKIYLIVGNGGSPVGSSISRNANGVGLNLPPLVPDKAAVELGFKETNQPNLKTYMSPKQLRALVDINESFKSGGVNAKNWKALQKDGASLTLSDDMTLRNVGGKIYLIVGNGGSPVGSSISRNANGVGLNLPPLVPDKAAVELGFKETNQPNLKTYMSPKQLRALVDINESFKSGGVNAKNWKALQKDGASLTLSDDMTLRNVGGKIYLIVGNGGSPVGSSISRNANGVGLNLPPLVPNETPLSLEQAQTFLRAELLHKASSSRSRTELETQMNKVADWVVKRAAQNPDNLKSEAALLKYLKNIQGSSVYNLVMQRAADKQDLPPINITKDQATAILFPAEAKPKVPSPSPPNGDIKSSPLTNTDIRDAIEKELAKIGFRFAQQRIEDYRNGRLSKKQALEGLTGDARTLVSEAINAIDQNKIPGGGANGGRSSSQINAEDSAVLINSWAERFNGYLGLDLALTRQLKAAIQTKLSELAGQGLTSEDPRIKALNSALEMLISWEASLSNPNAGTDRLVEFINKQKGKIPTDLASSVKEMLDNAINSGKLNTLQLQDYKAALDAISVVAIQRVSNRTLEDLTRLAGGSMTISDREIPSFTNPRTGAVTPGYTAKVLEIKGPISRELAAYLANGNIVGNRRTYSREDLERLIGTFQSADQIVIVGKLNNDAIQGRDVSGAPVTGDRRWDFGVASITFNTGLNGADNRSDYLGNVYQDANGQGKLVTEEAISRAFSRGKDLVGYTTGAPAMSLYNSLNSVVTRVEVRGNSKATLDALVTLNWLTDQEASELKQGTQDRRDRRIVEVLTERIVGPGKKEQIATLLKQMGALDGAVRFDFVFRNPASSSGSSRDSGTAPPSSQPPGSLSNAPAADSTEIAGTARTTNLSSQFASSEPLSAAPKREVIANLNGQVLNLAASQLGIPAETLTTSLSEKGTKIYQVQEGPRFGLLAVKEDQSAGLFPKSADYISLASGSDLGVLESLVLQAREDSTKRRKDLAGVTSDLGALVRMKSLGANSVGVIIQDQAAFNRLVQWGRTSEASTLLRQNGLGALASELANPKNNQKIIERTLSGLSTDQLIVLSNLVAATDSNGALSSAFIYKFQFNHLSNQSNVSAWQVARAMGRFDPIPETDPRWKRVENWWQRLRSENPVLSFPTNVGASFDLLTKRVAYSATQTPQFQSLESNIRAQADRFANVVNRNPVLEKLVGVSQMALTTGYDVAKGTLTVAGKVALPIASSATVATVGLLGYAAANGKLRATVGRVGSPPSAIELQAAKIGNLQPGENFIFLETDAPGGPGVKAQMVISTGTAVIARPALAPGQTGSLPWFSINEEGMRLLVTATANAGRVNIATRYGTNNLAAGQNFEFVLGRVGANPARVVQPRNGATQLNWLGAADVVSWGATSNIYFGEYVLRDPRIRTIGGKQSVANSVISLNSAYDKNEAYFGPLQFPKTLPPSNPGKAP